MNAITKHTSSIGVFLFFALSLTAPSGYSYGAGLLMIAGVLLVIFDKNKTPIPQEFKILSAIFAFYFLLFVFEASRHGGSFSEIDRPIKFILALFAFYFLIARPPKVEFFWAGLSVGAIGAGLLALWQSSTLGTTRVEGFSMAIQFGNIAVLYGSLCLCGVIWSLQKKNKLIWISILLLAFIFGLAASFLSGSRGGWIILPFVFLFCAYLYRGKFKIRPVILSAMLVSITLYNLPGINSNIKHRFNDVVHDLEQYDQGITSTSIGIRIELLKGSFILIKEKPFLGHGTKGYEDGLTRLSNSGVINPAIISHAHNDVVDAWAKRGIFGMVSLLCMYLIPLIFFITKLQKAKDCDKSIPASGVVFISASMIFGLTQAFLLHNSGVMVYAFGLVIIISLCLKLDQRSYD